MVDTEATKPACRGCLRVFPDQLRLESHRLTCIQPQNGVSFSHMWHGGMRGTNIAGGPAVSFISEEGDQDKILPESQDLCLPQSTQKQQQQQQKQVF